MARCVAGRVAMLVPLLGLASQVSLVRAEDPPAARGSSFQNEVAPLVDRYCGRCHGSDRPRGGVNLLKFQDEKAVVQDREIWERVQEVLENAEMPPRDRPQPTAEESERITHWIEATLSQVECNDSDPGRVTIRRLNRTEYNNTIRDLVGIDFRPADDFPSDDVGYGFDNIGDVLTIPPILMEKYLAAAEEIARRAIVTVFPEPPVFTWTGASGLRGGDRHGEGLILASNGEVGRSHRFTQGGTYRIRARAFGEQAGDEPVRIALLVDNREIARFDVSATESEPGTYETRTRIERGEHRVAVAFLNDYYKPKAEDPKQRGDRNLIVEALEVQGPWEERPQLPESHKRIIFIEPTGDGDRRQVARQVIERFATRAFRRAVRNEEVDRLVLFDDLAGQNGERFEKGIQLAVTAILCSPNFLFRVEADGRPFKPDQARPLNQYEVASRLSYFLWSSMPDEELFGLARQGKLKDGPILEAQVRRMIQDPKAQALVENFAGQWLQLRNLRSFSPDPKLFPGFTEELRDAMETESELFFSSILTEERSIFDFLDADDTFLNETLASHYGIPGIRGKHFRKVQLPNGRRGGLITQASVLSVTSNPTRTSPVKRGKWILEQLLGTPPPPAPPNVPELEEQEGMLTGSLRERMEQHRRDPNCATCHERMDPLGFGLENYNAIGAWRDQDGPYPIDASGTLPSGKSFAGPEELKTLLLDRADDFARNLTEKLMTYALGRGLETSDRCVVDRIVEILTQEEDTLTRLITEIVKSDPFQRRGVERAE